MSGNEGMESYGINTERNHSGIPLPGMRFSGDEHGRGIYFDGGYDASEMSLRRIGTGDHLYKRETCRILSWKS